MLNQEQLNAMKPEERRQFLEDNAYKLDEGRYLHRYNPAELNAAKHKFSEESIVLESIETEFAGIKADYKGRIDSKKESNTSLLSLIKTGGEFKSGRTFLFPDYDTNIMYIYDESGQLVNYRELRTDEKQTSIHSLKLAQQDDK